MKVSLELTDHQALALAQMIKRIGWDDLVRLSNRYDKYPDGAAEADHMLAAINVLQRALRDEGMAPR